MSADLDELAAQLVELEAKVARLDTELAELGLSGPGVALSFGRGESVYASIHEWVEGFFAPTFGRVLGGELRWCASWAEHAEAVLRLGALWQSWEACRKDEPMDVATWLTTFLDPQLNALMGRSGPFALCSGERHLLLATLPLSPVVRK